jgi:integrase
MKTTLSSIISNDLFDALKKYKRATHDNILTAVRFVYKTIDKQLVAFDINDIEANADVICNKLNEINVASAYTFLVSLIMLYRALNKDEPEQLKSTFKQLKDKSKQNDNEKSKEILHDLNLKDVYEFYKSVELKGATQLSTSMRRVMICILKAIPLRLNELINLEYVDNQNNNYIDMEKRQLIIRVHKTDKRNGVKVLNIDDDIVNEVTRHRELYPKKFIFLSRNKPHDDVMDSTSSRHFLQSAIKKYCKAKGIEYKPFGIHNVRHQHATKTIEDGVDLKVYKKIKELEKLMGHSNFETTLKYYYKQTQQQPQV